MAEGEATAPVDDEPATDRPDVQDEPPASNDASGAPEDDVVRCDDCGADLSAKVIAYCQSARGRQAFGGANYCFGCQNKRRGKGEKGGAA